MPCQTLDLIRSLIPYVVPLIENITDFPEGYCDVTSAQILSDRNRMWFIMGGFKAKPKCGQVEGKNHIWVQFGDLNIDFTAHQFRSLTPYVSNIDGYNVLFGSDSYFTSLGFVTFPENQCSAQLEEARYSLTIRREFGNCSPTNSIHWCRI